MNITQIGGHPYIVRGNDMKFDKIWTGGEGSKITKK